MEKWLYALFMKAALPIPRPSHHHLELVFSPLNLTVFFKVLVTLSRNGYPAHWLADILTTILNNRVSTTARPPRTYPLQISETKKAFPNIHMDLEPFLTEFSTLAALWLPELPFGLISSAPLPSPSNICQHSIIFTDTEWHGDTKLPVFTILLADWNRLAPILHMQRTVQDALRRALMSDEKGFKEPLKSHAKEFRKHCAIITTWEWNRQWKKGSWWMDLECAARMKEEGWYGMMLRTDSWVICSKPEDLREKLKKGEG